MSLVVRAGVRSAPASSDGREQEAATAPARGPGSSALRANSPTHLPARERLIVWGGIAVVTVAAWLVLARMPMPASAMKSAGIGGVMAAGGVGAWSLRDAWLIFTMWTVMMVAMMLPSALPMVEMYARIARGSNGARGVLRASLFGAGYLIAWTIFSAAITAVQYPLEHTWIMSDAMRVKPFAGAVLLIATGIYQFTPLKQACLTQCRSPLGFFMTQWRTGGRGAVMMGLNHGAFCVGCCWLLMALMFVAGAMNLAWAIALTILVLLEKATPWGGTVSRVSGTLMLASGLALAVFG